MSLANKPPVQPEPKPRNFGQQPSTPSGLRRFAPLMGMIAGGGVMAAIGMYALQVIMPEHFRPAVVAGEAAGEAIRAEIEAMREAKIDLARREADATAQPQAKAQTDVAVANGVLQERTNSLLPRTEFAGYADIVCAGANIFSLFNGPSGPGDQPDQLADVVRKIGGVSCTLGNVIRQSNTANMIDAVRQATHARGAPMDNGAVEANAAPVQATPRPIAAPSRPLPRSLAEVYAISTPSRHWPQAYVDKARAFIRTLPDAVGKQLCANLTEEGDGWSVLVDRVQAYQALPDTPLPTAAQPTSTPAPSPVKVTAARPVEAAPVASSRFSVMQQGMLRTYSYRMPSEALRQIAAGLDLSHGYPDAWYARVASYQDAHRG